jgi:alpha-N-arabinofuranosidase
MQETSIVLHTEYQIGRVDPHIFGGFLEHMGRAVYGGVYDPESTLSDVDGFRADVLGALRRLDMTVLRYPGGNFASGYHWMDGVGPPGGRPTVRELAWKSIEPNQFGTDEFMKLCREMNWSPILTVNLGTGTPEEARNWVEYCNSQVGTRYSDMRAKHGHTMPHGVKLWCLGNEMDGPWQLGHVPADQYAVSAQQAAKMMRAVDPSIELVACGSSGPAMPTYPEWDRVVLEYLGDLADYVSLHRYVGNPEGDTPDFLAVTNSVDRQIEEIDAVCRYVQAKRRSGKRAYLCFDEWNVWYKDRRMDGGWTFAPHLIEEVYNLEDALVVTGFLNSFIRHADVVRIANIAQIVNVIAPVLTRGDEMLIQSIFYPFEMYSKRREGASLRVIVKGPTYESRNYGEAHLIDASAILDGDRLHIFVTNRNTGGPTKVNVELADGEIVDLESAEILTGPDAKAANTFEHPELVRSNPLAEADLDVKISGGGLALEMPPLALVAMTLRL